MMDLANVIMQTVEMKVILAALVQISKFYAITNQTDAIWGIVWWEEKPEIIILPFAPASIRAIYFRYSDFTSHQCKSRAAALDLCIAAVIGIGSLGMQEATV